MKRALTVLVCGWLAGCEPSASRETWKEYKLAGGSFSVKLPCPPTEKISTLRLPPGNADQHTISSTQNGCVYKVMYLDYPDTRFRMPDPDGVLDNVSEGSASAINGRIANLKTISIGGYPGRGFIIETSDGKPLVYCRFYMVNNRLMQLMAIKKQSQTSTEDLDAFLQSLKLLKSR